MKCDSVCSMSPYYSLHVLMIIVCTTPICLVLINRLAKMPGVQALYSEKDNIVYYRSFLSSNKYLESFPHRRKKLLLKIASSDFKLQNYFV